MLPSVSIGAEMIQSAVMLKNSHDSVPPLGITSRKLTRFCLDS